MTVSSIDILSLIPQRPPFVMIGSLIYNDAELTRTAYTVSDQNIFVQDGLFREPGLLENIAQTAAASAGYAAVLENRPVAVGYIGAVKNLEIFSLPAVNDELETEIRVTNKIFDVTVVKGIVRCRGKLLAQCEMKIFISQSK